MKKIVSCFATGMLLLSVSCTKEAQNKDDLHVICPGPVSYTILGNWQLKEEFVSPGGSGSWIKRENGFTFTLRRDSTYQVFNHADFIGTNGKIVLAGNNIWVTDYSYGKTNYSYGMATYFPGPNISFSNNGDTLTVLSYLFTEGAAMKFARDHSATAVY